VNSEKSDLEKFTSLGLAGDSSGKGGDPFMKFFDDTTIDIQTGELLGRYIAEERDSGRRLKACYEALRENANSEDAAVAVANGELAEDLRCLREHVGVMSSDLEELRQSISALRN
jgi:hypothetical protein